jgi:8-oxo-dGTP pyrophosphatase MutT (NUDIX family)
VSEVVHRRAVRVLVVDPDQRVLMIHGFDPHQPGTTYWYTVGGGVHPGEGDREAAIREVWEETGRTTLIDDLRGPVHHDDVVFPFEGLTIVQEQVYYLLEVEAFEPSPVAFEETEIRSTTEVAWIDPRAREAAGEQVYPEGLAALVAAASSSGGSSASRPTASETTTSAPTSQNWL